MKIYREIKSVEINNDEIYSISYWESVERAREDGLEGAFNYRTKKDALRGSSYARASGYGRHSGRKLWQLPDAVIRQISKAMRPVII